MCVSFINCSMQSFQKLTTHWRANGNNKKALHKYSSQDFAMGMKERYLRAPWCSVPIQKAYVIHWVRLDRYSSVEKAYKDGVKRLEVLVSRVQNIDP